SAPQLPTIPRETSWRRTVPATPQCISACCTTASLGGRSGFWWRPMIRTLATCLAATVGLAFPPQSLAVESVEAACVDWCVDQDQIEARMVDIEFVQVPPRPNPYRYRYTNECPENYMVRIMDLCLDGGIPEPPEGCDGARIIPPRWAQLRDDGSGLPGPWILEAGYTCPGDPDYPVRLEDFAALPIAPSRLEIQPSSGWVYAGLDTIAYTDPAPQGFEVALLGITFFVGAVPVEYSWDFGDGSPPLVTSDPGRPWPDHTISHRYST